MNTNRRPTYISLFSSAGIGCYGFHLEHFDCVATNELIPRRLDIQRYNHKCKYESGYICGDLAKDDTKAALYDQIDLWRREESVDRIDVVIATPPCQGMSVANHKKRSTEIIRNSLVIESIKIIRQIHPRFFIFENVPAFMKTICTDTDGVNKPIAEAIESSLGAEYSYVSRIINFKNYGACSSRQRTLVIGVSADYADEVSPLELYPAPTEERTLRQVIGNLKPLSRFGEIDESDIYHSFRVYPQHMRAWIADLDEGQSAFENSDQRKKPHQIRDGKLVVNQQKNGDKYRRQYWDKVGPCIHTRNDQLASQNTIHPRDDRVFSIRELMLMMTVPRSFKWVEEDLESLNRLSPAKKRAFLKKEEIKIRQSLGEAVPTAIFQAIARKIAKFAASPPLNRAAIHRIVKERGLSDMETLARFITENPLSLSAASLGKIAELANTSPADHAAFFTGKALITEMMKALPDTDQKTVRILEPSVGVGNFVPLIAKKFEGRNVILDVMDIDAHSLELARLILANYDIPDSCTINYIADDFLLHEFGERYDYVIGNPPFQKMKSDNPLLRVYRGEAVNRETTNICSFFLDKAMRIGNYVALVFPKFLLNTPEFAKTREYLSTKAVESIIDFGEKGFPGVLVETLAVFINPQGRPSRTRVWSMTRGVHLVQLQSYIFDRKLPYWIIYRSKAFDQVCKRLDFNVFRVFRDRQITNKLLSAGGGIRVLKSRNISDSGDALIDIDGYDSYISPGAASSLAVYEYLWRDDVYLTPNMTYKPRVIRKPAGALVNGSVAILIPKSGVSPTEAQLAYFSTPEYRDFYQIARNYQTRSLNVDACSVFFYGLLRAEEKASPIEETLDERENVQRAPSGSGKAVKKMLTQQDLENFCSQFDYDLRKSGNGRWIDQKCAADVVTVVADCIYNYALPDARRVFTTPEIWHDRYTVENVEAIFKKPGVECADARNEYDKFFQQPMEMLANAGVLRKAKHGNKNFYQVNSMEVLEYIALRERNALFFLRTYIEKVLRDSGIYPAFEAFFQAQTKDGYQAVKKAFSGFIIRHTKINGVVECNRIFIKVLNPLAYFHNSRGTEKGRLSQQIITYDMLMYNRNNFRDLYADKPKGVTRREYAAAHPAEVNEAYYRYQSAKAKRYLRLFNDQNRGGLTEHLEPAHLGDQAIHMHHIFPEALYPEIGSCLENLAALTPTQHLSYAHPGGRTQEIDRQYQRLLLLSKVERIRENLADPSVETIYEFSHLLFVLSVGFDDDRVLDIAEMDFDAVINAINLYYAA